jgi:2-keto-3-deoxy-L-rhamnonate aldolase RhmA
VGRFLDKLANGESYFGTLDSLGGPQLAEVLGESGFDMACLDTMFCAFDWQEIFHWSRACLHRGLDPVVRLPSHPWGGASDSHVPAQVGRAFGIGLNGVCVSLNTPDEIADVLEVSRAWHKNLHLHPFKRDSFDEYARATATTNVVIPLIESQQGIDNIAQIMELDGLRVVWLGLSDISRILGHPFDYEAPAVWRFINHAVELGCEHGVAISANVGYEFSRDLATLAKRIEGMRAHGIQGIMLQNTGYMVQWMYRSVIYGGAE